MCIRDSRYHDYRDHSRSKAVMAEALRDAYADIFLIKEHPGDGDKKVIQGKFKSFHNVSDNVALNMTRTFYALLPLSDLTAKTSKAKKASTSSETHVDSHEPTKPTPAPLEKHPSIHGLPAPGLHYNIQIHLPASKDVEVYNAIFKSLREHLLEG